MYTLMRSISVSDALLKQAPAFIVSLIIAETIYRFHSFVLECLAFLVTWFVFDFVISFFIDLRK